MLSLKSLFVRQIHGMALATGFSIWRARQQNVRRILMLHGVGPEDELSAESLDQGLAWLATRFPIVPLADLIDGVTTGRRSQGEVAITFDDGLRCHLEQAYPVLVRRNTPATFFVCPGLMESRCWLWNHEARTRLQRLDRSSLQGLVTRWGAPSASVETIVDWMKTLEVSRRQTVEEAIRRLTTDFTPSDSERARFDPLTWADLASLDTRLVTIGSHTLLHPILPTLDDAALNFELRESRARLEERLGRSVNLFCYPNGSTDERVRAAAARVYGAAVTTECGHVHPGANLLRLPRFALSDRLPLLAWRLHRPTA